MPEKILIVGPSWVGDMVMAQSLFRVLKQSRPHIQIDVLAPDWSRPVLERMAEVHRAIAMPIGHGKLNLLERYSIAKRLRVEKYNQAIVLPNSFKSALIPYWAKIPKRTAWRGEMRFGLINDMLSLNKEKYPLMIERFMTLGLAREQAIPMPYLHPRLSVKSEDVQACKSKFLMSDNEQPILAICPGAEYGPAKRWPEKYFADIAKQKMKAGWRVLIFGSMKDKPIATNIQNLTSNKCLDLTGKTDLGEAIDLLSLATEVISNDSGLMHISAALDRPMRVIYGSSDTKFTPPLSEKAKAISLNLDCSPCFKRICPLEHTNCLNQLTPEMVLSQE